MEPTASQIAEMLRLSQLFAPLQTADGVAAFALAASSFPAGVPRRNERAASREEQRAERREEQRAERSSECTASSVSIIIFNGGEE